MTKPVSSTSQWRKLVFSKEHSDQYGYVWRISTWKVLLWLIVALIFFVIAYSFMIPNQHGYMQNVFFYAIITVLVVIVMWLLGNFAWKGRKFFVGFILAWILIFVFYWVMGAVFGYFKLMTFHYGMSVWIVITALAIIGANRIDGSIDKVDFFYGLMIFIVLIGGNLPAFSSGGFYAELDKLLKVVIDALSKGFNLSNLFQK